jgi:cytidine deaminase
MLHMLPVAQEYAIADFRVGAVAEGASGALYLGANREIPKGPLAWTVHAEQSAVLGAFLGGEKYITRLAVSAAPCGHCRQFLYELHKAADLEILIPGSPPIKLPELLPHAFGPADLGRTGAFFAHDSWKVGQTPGTPLETAAIQMLQRSYAPYTRSPAAVALETIDGAIIAAPYVENAAYNPSVTPMAAAFDRLRFHKGAAEIRNAVLVETHEAKIEQFTISRDILAASGCSATLEHLKIQLA